MYYAVTAHFKPDTAAELLRKVKDGTIETREPDGREIVSSMKRAVIDEEGVVRWSEVCYCATPLQHERATVYDHHFTDFQTKAVENYVEFEGVPFMEFLEK